MQKYKINEIFYSIQGEGARCGTANIFVRFSACNLKCNREEHGFDCDTEFESGTKMDMVDIVDELCKYECEDIIFTGGEPMLQVDEEIAESLTNLGYRLHVETNGTVEIKDTVKTHLSWVCVSPKTAEHTIKVKWCNELRYVRCETQAIPKTKIKATYYYISPAFFGLDPDPLSIQHCINLVKENPTWRLSIQSHKLLNAR